MIELNKISIEENFLESFNIENLIAQWENNDIHDLCINFRKHFETVGDGNERNLCILLWAATSFHFKPHNHKEPYDAMSIMGEHRSPIPADFSDQQLSILLNIAQIINNVILKARLADVVWMEKRNALRKSIKKAGEIALNSFLILAKEGLDAGDIHHFLEGLDRAIHLANHLKADIRDQLIKLCATAAPMMIDKDAPCLLEPLLKIAINWKIMNSADVRELAKKSAQRCESAQNWHMAAEMLLFAASTYGKDEQEQSNTLKCQAADVFERAAEFAARRGSAVMAAHFQERAIEILRRAGGTAGRREQYHQKLLSYQQAIHNEMNSHTHSIDLSDLIISAERKVSGKDFMDAIFCFIGLSNPPKIHSLVDYQKKMIQQYSLSTIFGGALLDHDGKTIAKFTPVQDADGLDDPGMRHRVIQQANLRQEICARGQLYPAIQIISSQHLIHADKFHTIVANSPFVPSGREHIFCIAFERMFENRIMEALHLLLPQFENSIRHILRERDVITVKIKKDMTQEDMNLNDMMFGETGAELEKILGKDLRFDLQSILVDRFGQNLRNIVAHGKASTGEMYSDHALYFCWMVLRLCCLPLVTHWSDLVYLDEIGEMPENTHDGP